ncbi:Calcineurin-like phosphoesterase [Variovorax sp. YR266]|nr:Calcineurin-like phosphoesterase [Variovorax sp. YR266]
MDSLPDELKALVEKEAKSLLRVLVRDALVLFHTGEKSKQWEAVSVLADMRKKIQEPTGLIGYIEASNEQLVTAAQKTWSTLDAHALDRQHVTRPLCERLEALQKQLQEIILSRPPSPPPPPRPPPPPPPVTVVGAVCSDVHLGTKQAGTAPFQAWLKARKAGEEVVLLGDVLDFWLFVRSDKPRDFVNRVAAAWDHLYKQLARLVDRGVNVHYVPGNHDSFAFFVEAAEHVDWARVILDRTPELLAVRDKTAHQRITEVATVHYPFLELKPEEDTRLLLTHGHYNAWGWRMTSGMPEEWSTSVPHVARDIDVSQERPSSAPVRQRRRVALQGGRTGGCRLGHHECRPGRV